MYKDKGDMFGNLEDWGRLLDTIEELTRENRLHEHQSGLIRILRYKDNWRLREAVLECVGKVEEPRPDLIKEVMKIMSDENMYYDMRILAATALGELMGKSLDDIEAHSIRDQCRTLMRTLLDSPQPPIFHEAIEISLKSIDKEGT